MKARRDWADLPKDALLSILHRLDQIDILMSVDRVCRSWRRAARGEPSLWRRITIRGNTRMATAMRKPNPYAMDAVRRSAGQCEAFCGEYFVDDDLLFYLSMMAPCLRSLRLITCPFVTTKVLKDAVTRFPILEELELSVCENVRGAGVYKVAGDACPRLRRFRLSRERFHCKDWSADFDKLARRGIASMRGLRSLQLFGVALTDDGLAAVLDGCPELEHLDVRHCFNVRMGEEAVRSKCPGIKTLMLPGDSTADYDLHVYAPVRHEAKNYTSRFGNWYWNDGYNGLSDCDDTDSGESD